MISALMPVRDGGACLNTALESLYSQTLRPDECVVVDDGSLDSTHSLLENWRQRWSAVRVVRTQGVGVARALNLGIDFCNGDWIARMDADDRAQPERLARQMAEGNATAAALVGCEVRHWVEGDDEEFKGMRRYIEWANGIHSHDELANALWVDSPLPHPGWLVQRRALELVGGYNETADVPEDYEWLHRFFATARKSQGSGGLRAVKVAGEPLLDWADSATRLTRTGKHCTEAAFNVVKARALRTLLAGRSPELYVFGLGPKGKALIPTLREEVGTLRAIVDVSVKKIGRDHHDTPIWDVTQWAAARAQDCFIIICLGTPETRGAAEKFCEETGLKRGLQYIAL